MNTEALLRVADLVDKDIQIDMSSWVYRPYEGTFYKVNDKPVMRTPCGYVACAIGHAGYDPWFNVRKFFVSTFKQPMYREHNITYHAWAAITQFFDINEPAAIYLFGTQSYPDTLTYPELMVTGEYVAQRIRDFVNVANREIT